MRDRATTEFYLIDYEGGAQCKNVLQRKIDAMLRKSHRQCVAFRDLKETVDMFSGAIDRFNNEHIKLKPEYLTMESCKGDIYLYVGDFSLLRLIKFILD